MKVQVVAGAQFGSEAKGHVTDRLIKHELDTASRIVYNVRVGGPNAGHTVYARDGQKFAFRQLPVGAVNPGVNPVIASGSEINMEVLLKELLDRREWAGAHGYIMPEVLVDGEATILTDQHINHESGIDLVGRIGSTGKGIGAARAGRLMRVADRVQDVDSVKQVLADHGCIVVNTAPILNAYNPHKTVIIEGTQGYGLGLRAGFYPQCTSGDCTVLDFMAQAEVLPFHRYVEPWIVARMFPIRVAGNSGPLEGETSWQALGLPEERTTVTNKVRRVGLWDDNLFAAARTANGGAAVRVALTMLDQRFPQVAGATTYDDLTPEALDWIREMEDRHQTLVNLVTTGPQSAVWLEKP